MPRDPQPPPPAPPLLASPGFRAGVSIAVAVGLYGPSFGALATTAGLSTPQAVALSALMFTGGSQFAFIGVLAGGGAPPAALGAAGLLGIRNGVYGMQINALLRPSGRLKPLAAHLTIDESTAVALGQDGPTERRRGFWTAGLGVFALWTAMTFVGAVAGAALGDPARWGLDGAAVAAFLGLLWPRLSAREPIAIAVAGALVTAVTVGWLPAGVPILVAAVVAGAITWWTGRHLTPGTEAR